MSLGEAQWYDMSNTYLADTDRRRSTASDNGEPLRGDLTSSFDEASCPARDFRMLVGVVALIPRFGVDGAVVAGVANCWMPSSVKPSSPTKLRPPPTKTESTSFSAAYLRNVKKSKAAIHDKVNEGGLRSC
jgi:hypothetical protein